MNADGGIGTAPSSTAARSSLPASKNYPCPRLRQTSPPHCTSMHSQLRIPRWALPSVLFALHAKTHAPTVVPHTHEIGRTHKHTRTHWQRRAHAHTHPHKCTLARRREGHSHMRRWVQRHRGDGSKGYQRREHQSDDHRPAANVKQGSGLIQPPCDDSFEWYRESGGFVGRQ